MTLSFHNIFHNYGRDKVLREVSFSAAPGEVTCLLGPSGCGKSTLLRLAAGMMPLQGGRIELDGVILADEKRSPPPEQRPIGLVFQENALFPHMTIAKNIAFGVRDKQSAPSRVASLLKQVDLEGFEARYPHTLSGGQQQRVALARALAPSPKVLLLDEPYASIDSQLRRSLRESARKSLVESGAISILVTHDPQEALEMADHIVVLDQGEIVQAGRATTLYDQPASTYIAQLFGDGQNIIGQVTEGKIMTDFGNWSISCLVSEFSGKGIFVVRPDSLDISGNENSLVKIVDIRSAGPTDILVMSAPSEERLRVMQPRGHGFSRGSLVSVMPKPESVFAFS